MATYLGEVSVNVAAHPVYSSYTPADWAMIFISKYGQIDGEHHKAWVLDNVSRILNGTPIELTLASWSNGEQEYRFQLSEPSQAYLDWRDEMLCRDENGKPEYDYDEGIAP